MNVGRAGDRGGLGARLYWALNWREIPYRVLVQCTCLARGRPRTVCLPGRQISVTGPKCWHRKASSSHCFHTYLSNHLEDDISLALYNTQESDIHKAFCTKETATTVDAGDQLALNHPVQVREAKLYLKGKNRVR